MRPFFVGSNTDGGYLAPVEWDWQLYQRQRATSSVPRHATMRVASVDAVTSLWDNDQVGTGWVPSGRPPSGPQETPVSRPPRAARQT